MGRTRKKDEIDIFVTLFFFFFASASATAGMPFSNLVLKL